MNLNNLNAESTELVPEKCNQKSLKEKKKEKIKAAEVQQPEEENIQVSEKPEAQREGEPETNKEVKYVKIHLFLSELYMKWSIVSHLFDGLHHANAWG